MNKVDVIDRVEHNIDQLFNSIHGKSSFEYEVDLKLEDGIRAMSGMVEDVKLQDIRNELSDTEQLNWYNQINEDLHSLINEVGEGESLKYKLTLIQHSTESEDSTIYRISGDTSKLVKND